MSRAIPVNSVLMKGNERKYLNACIQTGWISSEGPFIEQFENALCALTGRRYGIAVSSGTAALDIAVKAMGITSGDEVIMPAFTIISPAMQVVREGARPVLVDADPITFNMNMSEIEAKITPRTKAVIAVHTYGLPADMDPLLRIVRKYGLAVIEDAAEMHGQTYNGKPCGSFGDISVFSFYANKHISCGEGGMLLTDDASLAEQCRKLRNLSFEPAGPRFVHYELGWNYRMTNMQAALGLAQCEQLPAFLEKKRDMGAFYQKKLHFLTPLGYRLPAAQAPYARNCYWVFGIVAPSGEEKNRITACLHSQKIGTRPFFWCLHEQPVLMKERLFEGQRYPVAEELARKGFYIPSGLGLKKSEMRDVVHAISTFTGAKQP